jgi:nucleoside-diphosphate-sugar epimerase
MSERCLVTGVAGFIGSHLAERLLQESYEVIGVDCLSDYYPREVKEANLLALRGQARFQFAEINLCSADLRPLLDGVDFVLHQAAQPGVRASWGEDFRVYLEDNVLATQRLLEACKASEVRRFVYASSSSIYGDTADLPIEESSPARPISPYGVSKLAAEHLCYLYRANFGVPTVALRYFTVYGPRQRPDMAFHRFIAAIHRGQSIAIYGDGEQTRDFTFVADAVEANTRVLRMKTPLDWRVWNVGGGSRASVNEVIKLLEQIMGREAILNYTSPQHGDVRHTWADTTAARRDLGFAASTTLEEGLREQVDWQMNRERDSWEHRS